MYAQNGGEVKLTGLINLTSTHGIAIVNTGGGTVLLTGLTSLTANGNGFNITDTGNSTLALSSGLTSLPGVAATLDGTDAQVANFWTSLTGGNLTVTTGSYSLPGLINVDGSYLIAENGGHLTLPELKSYSSNGTYFQAIDANSVLDVSALTTVTQQSAWSVYAQNGGEVKLTGLTNLTSTHGITINDTGGSSVLLTGLTSLTANGNGFNITDTGNSTLALSSGLTNLPGVAATLDGTDAQVANFWTSLTGGSLTVTTGSYTLPGLTNVDGSYLIAENGGHLTLPALKSYSSNGTYFQATGANSVLDVSALTTVTQQSAWTVYAQNGGEVKLTGLTSLMGTKGINIIDTGAGTLLDTNLAMLNGVSVTTDGTDAQVANSWTQFTFSSLTVTGGSYSLPGLTDLDGSDVSVQNAGSLTLGGLKSYSSNGTYFQAIDANSLLDVSALTTLTQQGSWTVYAQNGGEVKLTGLTSLMSTKGINIIDTGGGTLLDTNVAMLNGVSVTTDGTDAQVANSWTQFTSGTLTVTGGSYSLPGLTDLDGSTLSAQNGGSLTVAGLKSYSSNGSYFQATGANSLLDVSADHGDPAGQLDRLRRTAAR